MNRYELELLGLSGYENATLTFKHITSSKVEKIGFLVSPDMYQYQESFSVQLYKTTKGYNGFHTSQSTKGLSLSGVIVDVADAQERLSLLNKYHAIIHGYDNENVLSLYNQYLEIEGIRYFISIEGLTINKGSRSHILSSFSMPFSVYGSEIIDKFRKKFNGDELSIIYDNSNKANQAKAVSDVKITSGKVIDISVINVLSKSSGNVVVEKDANGKTVILTPEQKREQDLIRSSEILYNEFVTREAAYNKDSQYWWGGINYQRYANYLRTLMNDLNTAVVGGKVNTETYNKLRDMFGLTNGRIDRYLYFYSKDFVSIESAWWNVAFYDDPNNKNKPMNGSPI